MQEEKTLKWTWNNPDVVEWDEDIEFSDEEKKIITSLDERVDVIKNLRKEWKPFYNDMAYSIFIYTFNQLDENLKDIYIDFYVELLLDTAKIKIAYILKHPMPSLNLDISWLKAQINIIWTIKPDFDFGEFNSEKVNSIIKN